MSTGDVTVREYGWIEDEVESSVKAGVREFTIDSLVAATGVEPAKVEETLRHFESKYEHVEREGDRWTFVEDE